jgi:SAM-dependent methyltransferase
MDTSNDAHQSGHNTSDTQVLKDCLQWDVKTWAAALRFWRPALSTLDDAQVLDLGARDGGLSLYFALLGHHVVCSDLRGPSADARALHQRYGINGRVRYAAVDATRIAFPDNCFDVVCFKSVLGGVGHGGRYDRQQQAAAEMHRVLRKGGLLLFAENSTGSHMHQFLRRRFVKWAQGWRYLALTEVADLFAPFTTIRTECHGVLASFGRTERQRSILHGADVVLDAVLPDRCKYMIAGVAVK